MADDAGSRGRPLVVAVFVGTRADLGPLSSIVATLQGAPDVDVRLLTGVRYAADDLAAALPPVASRREWLRRIVELAEPMGEVTVRTQLDRGALLSGAAGRAFEQLRPDVLVVLGDRWELLFVVPPALLLGIPIVHLHGGEVTEGALDERVRHAVTKLADQHCVASLDAARRLARMGEPPERIHVTGAPGLDRIAAAAPVSDELLAALLGVPEVTRPLALFTYHPPTAGLDLPVAQWAREAAEATLAVAGTVIASHPGFDEGRDAVVATLAELAATEPRFRLVEALGHDYPRVLASVDVVVGNSSSGIIEAAAHHVPAVDVGERQRGRLRGDNVVHADEGRTAVEAAVREALGVASRRRAAAATNPYGHGDASERVVAVIRAAAGSPRTKRFADPAPSGWMGSTAGRDSGIPAVDDDRARSQAGEGAPP